MVREKLVMAKKDGANRALRSSDPSDDERKDVYRKVKGGCNRQTYPQRAISSNKSRAKKIEHDYRALRNAKINNSLKRKRRRENVIVIHSDSDDDSDSDDNDRVGGTSSKEIKKHGNSDAQAQRLPCARFRVPSPPVELGKSSATPLLEYSPAGDGGVQGLNWYLKSLRTDGHNDMAHEFLVEVSPDGGHNRGLPTFRVNHNIRRANVTNKILNRYFQNPDTSKEDA